MLFGKMLRRNGSGKIFRVSSISVATSLIRCYIGKVRIPCVHKRVKTGLSVRAQGGCMTGVIFNTLREARVWLGSV